MENGLVEQKKNLVSLVEEKNLGDVIKPLSKEIHLFDTYVAGTTYAPDQEVFEEIKSGDKIVLQREDNKYDSNAIICYWGDKKKIGYIPEKDNIVFARLMDAGKFLTAKIDKIYLKGTYNQVNISIYLVDF